MNHQKTKTQTDETKVYQLFYIWTCTDSVCNEQGIVIKNLTLKTKIKYQKYCPFCGKPSNITNKEITSEGVDEKYTSQT